MNNTWVIDVVGFEYYRVVNSETGNVVLDKIYFHSIAENLIFQLENNIIDECDVIQPLTLKEIEEQERNEIFK